MTNIYIPNVCGFEDLTLRMAWDVTSHPYSLFTVKSLIDFQICSRGEEVHDLWMDGALPPGFKSYLLLITDSCCHTHFYDEF